jgi:diguanylate cyclase (GGDEF)-like protein/PAS domain S-box-containing protein
MIKGNFLAGGRKALLFGNELLAILLWTGILAASLWWSYSIHQERVFEMARLDAITSIDKDWSLRLWAISHGGVYMPPDDKTPPNPYLNSNERNLITKEGKYLTFMNPPYFMRQVMEHYAEFADTKGHMTSLALTNPLNAPDQWEVKALKSFKPGMKEIEEIVRSNGKRYLRLIRPVLMESSCMKCHGNTGVKVGEVRGGISTMIAMEPFYKAFKPELMITNVVHGTAWLIGMLVIGFISWRSRQYAKTKEHQRLILEEHKEQLRLILDSAGEGILGTDSEGVCTFCNPMCLKLLGYVSAEELVGKNIHELIHYMRADGSHLPIEDCLMLRAIREGEGVQVDDEVFWRADGSCFPVEYRSFPQWQHGVGVGVAVVFTDITERKRSEARISFLAHHDPLTGLPNRILLEDRVKQAIGYAGRSDLKAALLFLDIDRFKNINDSLGHKAGDDLLKSFAVRLRACIRETDTASRQGGDEFIIVLSAIPDPDVIIKVLSKIRAKMSRPFEIEGNVVSVSVSVGIAVFPDDGDDFVSLLKKADTALYKGKASGGDNYRFYTNQMNIDGIDRLQMQIGLQRALDHGEFVLHYQPQIDLSSGSVIGVEALIRWNDPQRGLILPDQFISIAEDNGLITQIGKWVLGEACRQMVEWKKAGLPHLVMAVNLSSVQFNRGDLEQTVASVLADSGLDPANLELELTESILMQSNEVTLNTLYGLKSLGILLSIDDFGTGYSSLAYLKHFPVDKLKIDKVFIQDLTVAPDSAAITLAIIKMAQCLKLQTIAEGVEFNYQVAFLKHHNCTAAQGFHFSHPIPAEEFSSYMSRNILH